MTELPDNHLILLNNSTESTTANKARFFVQNTNDNDEYDEYDDDRISIINMKEDVAVAAAAVSVAGEDGEATRPVFSPHSGPPNNNNQYSRNDNDDKNNCRLYNDNSLAVTDSEVR